MSLLKDQIEIEVQEAELATQKALADFPAILRWLTILVAVLIIPAYFITKNVSHGIWQNRLNEGRVLSKSSFEKPLTPKTSNVFLTTLGANTYAAAVLVTNPNLDLSITSAPFQFTFLNADKQPVYSYTNKLFLLPNENKYIVVPTFSAQDKIVYANFEILGQLNWQKKIEIPKIEISASKPDTYSQFSPFAFVVEGSFTNNSPYQFKMVKLTYILLDPSGTIIGASTRDENTVAPFERRTYKQLWPNLNSDNIAEVKVFATTNILDPSNIVLPDYNPDNSSSLGRPTPTR